MIAINKNGVTIIDPKNKEVSNFVVVVRSYIVKGDTIVSLFALAIFLSNVMYAGPYNYKFFSHESRTKGKV